MNPGHARDSAQAPSPPRLKEKSNKPRTVKEVLEKLSEFLTENNLEEQIQQERKEIHRKIDIKNEEISSKRETHRHKLNDIHEAYKSEIQRENERHLEDLKVTEVEICSLRSQLEELEQLNSTITSRIPGTKAVVTERETGRLRELLECPVCLDEMRPPKKIFQCSNGHVICELCKSNPEVRSCPTCRVQFRGGSNFVRNIVAEKLARNTFEAGGRDDNHSRASHSRESNPVDYSDSQDVYLAGFQPGLDALDYIGEEEEEPRDDEEEFFFHLSANIIGDENSGNQHRRLAADRAADRATHQSQSRDELVGSPALPRLRQAHLFRTYRPNTRYVSAHQRRQRTGREEEESTNQSQQQQHISAPRISRRSNNFPLLR